MTDIGGNNSNHPIAHGLLGAASARVSWERRIDAWFDGVIQALTGWLCRASRGYLCPPDMTSVMYPDETPTGSGSNSRSKECCNEKLPGK